MPRQPRNEVAMLRNELWESVRGRCEWPGCHRAAMEMAHRKAKGMGGRSKIYTMRDVFALCRIHHRCQDGAGGELIDGTVDRKVEVAALYEEVNPMNFPGDHLLTLDQYVNHTGRQYVFKLQHAISEALASVAFLLRVPRTENE